MVYETIILDKKDHIATLTLNRPDRLNAVNAQVCRDVMAALDDVNADDDIRVLVLTGAGRGFCSGADVQGMPGGSEATGEDSKKGTDMQRQILGSEMVIKIQELNKPTIAMVNGVAAGGGAALALGCDMRIGSEHARFINAFVRVGLSAGWGSPWLYPNAMGLAKALEIMLTGDALGAEEAYRVGALNKLVPAGKLQEETMALAQKLAAGPPIAIRETKRQIYAMLGKDLRAAVKMADEGEHVTIATEDHREAVRAFLEKRKPVFKGK